jgi:hypothetical protein
MQWLYLADNPLLLRICQQHKFHLLDLFNFLYNEEADKISNGDYLTMPKFKNCAQYTNFFEFKASKSPIKAPIHSFQNFTTHGGPFPKTKS